jgi:hypothetical protein
VRGGRRRGVDLTFVACTAAAAACPLARAMGSSAGSMASVLLIMASAAAGTSGAPPNATNSSTGVVTDAAALYRTLPLKQLRLITPNHYGVSGTDAVTLVFNRAVVALGSTFHGGDGSRVNGVAPMLWSCNSDDGHSAGESLSSLRGI